MRLGVLLLALAALALPAARGHCPSGEPCIRKCCPIGKMAKRGCIPGGEQITVPEGVALVHAKPNCEMFMISKDEEYTIHYNGTVLYDGEVMEYCMDWNHLNDTYTYVCFPPEDESVLEEARTLKYYSFGLWISFPFLLATFLVYASLKRLWNIHGRCVTFQTLSMLLAYVCLGIVQGQLMEENPYCTILGQPKIFVDGTFSHCAKYFYQFFTVHTIKNGHYIPLVFGLLPDKRKETYKLFFEHLITKLNGIGLNFSPKTVIADFEIGIHLAAKSLWPDATLSVCRFHLCQSWWRKIQELGLSTVYHSGTESGNLLKLVFGLPFLQPELAEESFVEDFMSVCQDNIRPFFDYLVEFYIDSSTAKFPPEIWASSEPCEQTTNVCESFHAKFKQNFNSSHPNIFTFMEAIKDVEIPYISMRSSHVPKQVKACHRRKMQYLRKLKTDFENCSISRK